MKHLLSWLFNRPRWAGRAMLVALLVLSVAISWLGEPYPLSHAHWDAPIHLLSGKAYSEGDYLPRLRERAVAVHDELMRGLYPGEYWSFVRLGHIALVGTVVQSFGTDAAAIGIVAGFYRLLFAIGLFAAAMFSIALVRASTPSMTLVHAQIGASISLALYLMSDVARYMSGNPVSEVPAILLLALSAWTLVIALEKKSPIYAVISGCLAFMLYAVRVESVWLYVSLLLAFAVHPRTLPGGGGRVWSILTVAAAASALLFLAYSWILYPLTDPRLFGALAEAGVRFHGKSKVWIGIQVIAANALLWIGAAAALPMFGSNRAVRIGVLWLALAMLPVAIAATAQYATQTRMYSTLLPAVFLLSTAAWSHLVMTAKGGPKLRFATLLGLSLAVVLISQPMSYSYLRTLPGMWRLQFVREYVAVGRYEQIDYHLPELATMKQIIDQFERPLTLIASPGMQVADHIMIMQFLQTSDHRDDGSRATPKDDLKAREWEALDIRLADDPAGDVRFVKAHVADRRVLLVGTAKEESWLAEFSGIGGLKGLFSTVNFRLVEVTPNLDETTSGVPRNSFEANR